MVYGVVKLTPFGMSILPTPILLSSISKVTTTAPLICTKIVLLKGDISNDLTNKNSNLNIQNPKEEGKEYEDVSSNLNVAAATDDNNDDFDNAKSPPWNENLIGDLDGIKDEYSPNIPNDGEILLLPLFSPVY